MLTVLRHDQRLVDTAGAYQVSAPTVRCWLLEVIHLLAAAPSDWYRSTAILIPARRRTGADDRPNYSGERKTHGLHVLALTDEKGNLLRF